MLAMQRTLLDLKPSRQPGSYSVAESTAEPQSQQHFTTVTPGLQRSEWSPFLLFNFAFLLCFHSLCPQRSVVNYLCLRLLTGEKDYKQIQ
jgi:hypothetical protein